MILVHAFILIFFQDKEVPGEPLTPQDFENAENLGKQHAHSAKTCIVTKGAVISKFRSPKINE
jgi:hypothetical protein